MTVGDALKRVLLYGAIMAASIAIVGSVLGYLFVGPRGLVSALVGTALACLFLALTAASILVASRQTRSDLLNPVFFAIVLGGWLLKFVAFMVVVFLLKDQPWLDNVVFFLSIVAGVVGSFVVDLLVVANWMRHPRTPPETLEPKEPTP